MTNWLASTLGASGALLFSLTFPRWPARAAEVLKISWQAPEECPSAPEAVARVEDFLGASLRDVQPQALRFETRISTTASATYRAEVRVHAPEGARTRTLQHAECQRLTEAAALVIALAIDPERVQARQRELEEESKSNAAAPAPSESTASDAPEVARRGASPSQQRAKAERSRRDPPRGPGAAPDGDSSSIRWEASGGVPMIMGSFGAATLGLEAALGATAFERWRAASLGDYWFVSDADIGEGLGATVELASFGGGLMLCYVRSVRGHGLDFCAGAVANSISATGKGVEEPRTERALWWGPFGELAWTGVLSDSLLVRGAVGGGPALARPVFGVTVSDIPLRVFQPEPWFAWGKVALVYSFSDSPQREMKSPRSGHE